MVYHRILNIILCYTVGPCCLSILYMCVCIYMYIYISKMITLYTFNTNVYVNYI